MRLRELNGPAPGRFNGRAATSFGCRLMVILCGRCKQMPYQQRHGYGEQAHRGVGINTVGQFPLRGNFFQITIAESARLFAPYRRRSRVRYSLTPNFSPCHYAHLFLCISRISNAPTLSPKGIPSISPGLRLRSFRQPFTISTTQNLTVLRRAIRAPPEKSGGATLGNRALRQGLSHSAVCLSHRWNRWNRRSSSFA